MKRVLTAMVALPILLFAIWSRSPYPFAILATAAILLALSEFYDLSARLGPHPSRILGYAAAISMAVCFVTAHSSWIVAILSLLVFASLAASLSRTDEMEKSLAAASATLFGAAYVGMLGSFLIGVRMTPEQPAAPHLGPKLITTFLAIVMLTDTGAYYIGRAIGRHKLSPKVSPGKTIEGAIGGLIAGTLAGPICSLIFFRELPLIDAALLGGVVSVIGQAGDLAESMLKRGSGVKDSSNLLPGHGGMLDRLDSILVTAPLIYYYSRHFVSKH